MDEFEQLEAALETALEHESLPLEGLLEQVSRVAPALDIDWSDDADLGQWHETLDEVLLEGGTTWTSKKKRVARLDQVFQIGVFTHRLTGEEIESNRIAVGPDLGFFTDPDFADLPAVLSTGGVIDVVSSHAGPHVVGPEGWLRAGIVGEFVALSRGPDLEVSFLEPDDLGPGQAEREALDRFVAEHRRDECGIDLVAMLLDLITDRMGRGDERLFAVAVPPLGELLATVGLSARDGEAAPIDAHWFSAQQRYLARRIEAVAQSYDFDSCCQKAFDQVWDAYQEAAPAVEAARAGGSSLDGSSLDGSAIGRDLVHGDVVRAFAEVALGRSTTSDPGLAALIEAVLASEVDNESRAAALYLAGLHAERVPDAHLAEKLLQEAVQVDPDFLPAREELAYYVLDRGDLDGAIRLMQDDRYEPDGVLEILTDLRDDLRRPFASIGRNDRCPCGSGRKYKACCLRDRKPSVDERLAMIDTKTSLFSFRPHRRLDVELISDLVENGPEFLNESIGLDAVQIEGDLLVDYLAERGDLLPEAERVLIEEMIRRGRRLGRVVEVDDTIIAFELLPDGERLVFPNDFPEPPPVGEALFLRPISTNDGEMIVGLPLPIDAELIDDALELLSTATSGFVFLDWLLHASDRLPLRSESGEDLIMCSVRYEVSGILDELEAWLEQSGAVAEERRSWHVDDSEPNGDPVMLRVDEDDVLGIGAITRRQFDEIRSLIEQQFGALPVISESVEPLRRGDFRRQPEADEVDDASWGDDPAVGPDDPLSLW